MRLLDRYIIKNFLVNFVLALTVLVGLFILFDLIVNAHDFARGAVVSASGVKGPSPTIWDIAGDIGDYYLYQLPVIFQQVSGIHSAPRRRFHHGPHDPPSRADRHSGVGRFAVSRGRPDHSYLDVPGGRECF